MATGPSQTQYEASPDPATRRALFDLKRLASGANPFRTKIIYSPGSITDHTAILQQALDSNDVVLLGAGTYRADGLVVPANTTLGTLQEGHGVATFGSATVVVKARDSTASDYVVSFPNGTSPRAEQSALVGLAIDGNEVCGGVYTEGWYGIVRDVHISNTAGVGLNVQSQSILVDRCLVTGPWWPDIDPTTPSGAVIVGGADSWFRDCEFSASNVTSFAYRGDTVAAVYVTGSYHSFVGCIAEYGDHGWHFTSAALFNKLTTCRADRNWGDGFLIQGAYNMLSSCSASDCNMEDDGYGGFNLSSSSGYNTLSSCRVWNALTAGDGPSFGNANAYGFNDDVLQNSVNRNQLSACGATQSTVEFDGDGAWDTGWVDVTFENSWVNDGGANVQDVQYRRVGEWVTIRGAMKNGTINATAFTLPTGFRPPDAVGAASANSGAIGMLFITAAGSAIMYTAVNTQSVFHVTYSVR